MTDSSESSPPKRRERSRSEEKQSSGKLFITNLDGKVLSSLYRQICKISKLNLEDSFKNVAQSITSLPNATVILNTALHLQT